MVLADKTVAGQQSSTIPESVFQEFHVQKANDHDTSDRLPHTAGCEETEADFLPKVPTHGRTRPPEHQENGGGPSTFPSGAVRESGQAEARSCPDDRRPELSRRESPAQPLQE